MIVSPLSSLIIDRSDRTRTGRITSFSGGVVVNSRPLPVKALGMISKLTPRAKEKFPAASVNFDFRKLYYINPQKILPGKILFAYDGKNCYPRIALLSGFLSVAEFKELCRFDKGVRMNILGGLSTEKETVLYENGKEKERISKPKKSDFFDFLAQQLYSETESLRNSKECVGQFADCLFFEKPQGRKIPCGKVSLRLKEIFMIKEVRPFEALNCKGLFILCLNEKGETKQYHFVVE